jgi:bifunctional DNA-binding transcriptional regulator/antitoxin component of YhaV-PrlF toxin-antitoxin module
MVTAGGRVTLKQDMLKHLGVSPGDKIEADKLPKGRIVLRVAQNGSIEDFIGCLSQRRGRKLTLNQINETAAERWQR